MTSSRQNNQRATLKTLSSAKTAVADMKAKSKSKAYYDRNPKAKAKKKAYDTEYHSTEERKEYRAFLNKKRRDAGRYGNGDGMDYDHTERKFIAKSKNRAKK